jgi:transposase-like protein
MHGTMSWHILKSTRLKRATSSSKYMDLHDIKDSKIAIHEISDKEVRPDACIKCGHEKLIIANSTIHDLWELGSPGIARIMRHEKVRWRCKHCGEEFRVLNTNVPFNSSYTYEVIKYALHRVLKKGDSMRRVAKDLNELHNVKIDDSTILQWVGKKRDEMEKERGEPEEEAKETGPDLLTLDGTFKFVGIKKTVPIIPKDQPFSLHITRLKNGKLVAILPLGKAKRK